MTDPTIVAPNFAKRYIALVDKSEIDKAIRKNTKNFSRLLKQIPKKKRDFAYSEGKWTLRQLLQHLIDAERVFTFRALWFARKDGQPLPGFNENSWAVNADVSGRSWDDMIAEFQATRKSTEQLFASFSEQQLNLTGTSNNELISVKALGYMCAGHIEHHIKLIQERYL